MDTSDLIGIAIFGLNLVVSLAALSRARDWRARRSALRSVFLSIALIVLVLFSVRGHPSHAVYQSAMAVVWSLLILVAGLHVLDWREGRSMNPRVRDGQPAA